MIFIQKWYQFLLGSILLLNMSTYAVEPVIGQTTEDRQCIICFDPVQPGDIPSAEFLNCDHRHLLHDGCWRTNIDIAQRNGVTVQCPFRCGGVPSIEQLDTDIPEHMNDTDDWNSRVRSFVGGVCLSTLSLICASIFENTTFSSFNLGLIYGILYMTPHRSLFRSGLTLGSGIATATILSNSTNSIAHPYGFLITMIALAPALRHHF